MDSLNSWGNFYMFEEHLFLALGALDLHFFGNILKYVKNIIEASCFLGYFLSIHSISGILDLTHFPYFRTSNRGWKTHTSEKPDMSFPTFSCKNLFPNPSVLKLLMLDLNLDSRSTFRSRSQISF